LFRIFGKSLWKKNEGVAHTLAYDVAIMGNFSLPGELLEKISLPTLVIGGEKSPEKLLNAVKAVSWRISHSELCLLKGQSHNVSMKVLAPEITHFFNHRQPF
ncbi:MAG TPA: hypothetical protein VNW49_13735, partial [Puia sp.]|nr:hypothetical protein [Puia sp.]